MVDHNALFKQKLKLSGMNKELESLMNQ